MRYLFSVFIFFGLCGADEYSWQALDLQKYHLSVCSVFKNEAKQLKEWIEYHRLVGVEHFYLYNAGSSDDYVSVLRPYVEKGIVTLQQWPEFVDPRSEHIWMLGTKMTAYENAVRFRARDATKWLAFLDVNEYLTVRSEYEVSDYLNAYSLFDSIELVSYNYETPLNRRLTIDSRRLTLRFPQSVSLTLPKMIVQPKHYQGFTYGEEGYQMLSCHEKVQVHDQSFRVNRYWKRPVRPARDVIYVKEVYPLRWQMTKEEIALAVQGGDYVEDAECSLSSLVPAVMQRLDRK